MGMFHPDYAGPPRLALEYVKPDESASSFLTGHSVDAAPLAPVSSIAGRPPSGVSSVCPHCGRPRAAIYVRVSTPGQEDGTSLETQEEECRARAEALGYCVDGQHVFREVYSAAEMERPQLDLLMALVRRGVFAAVFVYHLDRWSRDPFHALALIGELAEHDTQLILVKGSLEDTPEGRLLVYVQAYAGQQERLQFVDRTRRGKISAAKAGRLPNGAGPLLFGCDYDPVKKVRVINEVEAAVVRLIFQWASEGLSPHQIAVRLNNLGIPTKKGRQWHGLTVRRVLKNRAYTGTQVYGENRYRKVKGGTRRITPSPASEVIEIEGYTPQIISPELFNLVQERLAIRQAAFTKSVNRYLLTGFTKCLLCGSPVVGACLNGNYRYYRCRATVPTASRPATCKARYIRADDIEEYVYGLVCRVVSDPSVLACEVEDNILREVGGTSDEIPILKRQIRELEEQQLRLLDEKGKGHIDSDLLEKRIAPVKAACDEKRKLLAALEEQQRLRDDAAVVRERIASYCARLEFVLPQLDFDAKRALFGAFGLRVEASRDDVSVTLVLDPKFTTIEQTLASPRERSRRCRWA